MGVIVFDCDGVLVDSEIVACRTVAATLSTLGYPLTTEEVAARFVGRATGEMLKTLEAEYAIPLPADLRERLLAAQLAAFESELEAVPGVAEALETLSAPRCVASGSDRARIEYSLALTGLRDFFGENLFSAQMVARGKPAPDLFLLAARSMGAPPEACLAIEDSPTGVEAALAAGMPVLGFCGASHCQPGHAERLRAAGAKTVFEEMRALPALVAEAGF